MAFAEVIFFVLEYSNFLQVTYTYTIFGVSESTLLSNLLSICLQLHAPHFSRRFTYEERIPKALTLWIKRIFLTHTEKEEEEIKKNIVEEVVVRTWMQRCFSDWGLCTTKKRLFSASSPHHFKPWRKVIDFFSIFKNIWWWLCNNFLIIFHPKKYSLILKHGGVEKSFSTFFWHGEKFKN